MRIHLKSHRSKAGLLAVLLMLCVGIWTQVTRADSLPNTGAPSGFSLTTVAEGLDTPTNAAFAPDGRIFVALKDGTVRVVKNGQLLGPNFYKVANVNNYGDRGLLGIAIDPNFANNGYVYLLYTYENNAAAPAGAKNGRLLRVTANGDTAVAGSEQVILGTSVGTAAQPSCESKPVNTDCIPSDGLSHSVGSVVFGTDGKLYITVGDSASFDDADTLALRAQNLDSLSGKVLRINPNGTGVTDNPYYTGNPNDNRSKVYAQGVRNAFRLNVRPSDNLVVLGDVGWSAWEEVNTVPKGANLGWPCYEGNEQQNGAGGDTTAYKTFAFCQQMYQNVPANLKFPTHQYPHPPGSAIVGGVFYTGDNYPAQFKNRYFYGDYVRNQIQSMALDGSNNMTPGSNQLFASNAAGPVAFFTGPQGDIYYIGIYTGSIYHIAYTTGNQAPTAIAAADKTFGPAPLTVNFTSSGSTDPENDTLGFAWDFGDGTPVSNDANPAHTYAADGTYTATLTVSDIHNNISTKTLTIHAGQTAPDITITTPADKTVATTDQPINFAATATDVVDGTLPGSQLQWQVVIQHCPLDSCHAHTLLTTTGSNGAFNFPAHDGPFYIQVIVSATNSNGLTTTKSVSVYPQGQKIVHALQFDGTNDFAVADASQDFKLQQFTAEAMVKTLATDTEGSEVMSMGNNWMVRILPGGLVYFIYYDNSNWHDISTDANIVDGLWHHIAVVRTTGDMKLYIDGALRAQAVQTAPIDYSLGNEFTLARHGSGEDDFTFNGTLDEVRFWNTARSAADIAKYRATTLPVAGRAGLVAYYPAEDGSGTTVADTSPTAAHRLNLLNGPTWTAGAPLSDPPTTIGINTLTDTFTGTTIDAAKWQVIGTASRTTQNGTLNVAPSNTAAGIYGISSKARYDLTNNAVMVEVPQVTTIGSQAETQLLLDLDGANQIAIGTKANNLYLRHRLNSTVTNTNVTYSATNMRWWRIREAGGTVFLETSSNATTWTVRRSFAKGFDLTNLKLSLLAGTFQTIASPGTAKFDNLNVMPAPITNNAMTFNGTTAKASATSTPFSLQTFTIEAWAKVQVGGGSGGAELIGNGNNYGMRVEPGGKLVFFAHSGNTIWKQYVTNVNLRDNAWHHIAAVKTGTDLKIYIDSVLKNTYTAGSISYTLGNQMVLGQHAQGDQNFNLLGALDEVRIWNVARTAAQIQASWKQELSPQAGLIGYWKCNEASGTTAADSSGNNRSLTLTAGVGRSAGFPKQ